MSHTTAIGRGRVRRCQKRHTRGSPPAPSERLSMARAARRRPCPARRRRRDGRSAKRGRKSASIAAASRASAGVSSAKSAVRSCSSALAPSRVVSATTSVTSTPGGASGPKLTSARGPSFWRNRGSSADARLAPPHEHRPPRRLHVSPAVEAEQREDVGETTRLVGVDRQSRPAEHSPEEDNVRRKNVPVDGKPVSHLPSVLPSFRRLSSPHEPHPAASPLPHPSAPPHPPGT